MTPEKRKDRRKLKTAAFVILAVLALNLVAVYYRTETSTPQKLQQQETVSLDIGEMVHNDINLALNVTVTNSTGQRVGSVYQPNDLINNNFYDFLIAFLDNAQTGQSITASVTNTGGTTSTPYVWGIGGASCSGSSCWGTISPGEGGLIEVGTGSSAATRADYVLTTPFQSYFGVTSACSQGATDSIIVAGSENANGGATITEAGLFIQQTFSGSVKTVMFAHDVFSGIVVSGGNTITIQYVWSLNNSGFNYNLCEYLAGMLAQPNGADYPRTPNALTVFYDTAGKNVTWVQACTARSSNLALIPLSSSDPNNSDCSQWAFPGNTENILQIAVGTGSASFSPTSRALTSYYAENYITSTTYDSAGNSYETATMLLVTGATISEAAIYLTLPDGCIGFSPLHGGGAGSCTTGYTTDTIMLLAATFSGQAVPNGQAIGITFQEAG